MTRYAEDPPSVTLPRRAAAELNLRQPKAWREKDTGRWIVSGFDRADKLRLYCPDGKTKWEELTVEGVS